MTLSINLRVLTGVNIHLPQIERNNGSVVIAGQNDPNEVVLPGPSISFWTDRVLGRGAFATVYEGKFKDECCAVKVLNQVAMHVITDLPTGPPDDSIERKAIQSVTRECGCLMTINHPNVVKLLDVRSYHKGDFPILIMERLDCSLTAYFKEHPNQNMGKLVQLSICCDVSSALNYLHANRIVHRDICGNNILLVLDNQSVKIAKISDFGMSRILKDFEGMSTTLTAIDGHRAAYYPPELQDECGSSDSSIDIYMFGVLMLQIAHEIPYVTRRDRRGLIQKLSERHILKSSIMWCTELERNKRPSAINIHESIKSLLEEYKQKEKLNNDP
jgi:cyclin-dependent kinase 7